MNARLKVEPLEQRLVLSGSSLLSEYVDVSQLDLVPMYTTYDSPANHISSNASKFNGVVALTIQTNQGTFLGSGVLLPTGKHILTAAHNLTDVAPDPIPVISSIVATFELPSGNIPINAVLGSTVVHPNWTRNLSIGNDLAIVELTSVAPTDAQRFDIYRESSELFVLGEKAGYGQAGQGLVTLASGTKRDGQNIYELFWDSTADILVYDFDNGNSANDTIGLIGGPTNLGLGNDEVMSAPGDSGGPTLIGNRIAGITSFGTRLGTGDVDSVVNSSFGEIAGDTRVSVFASWIDSLTDVFGAPRITDILLDSSTWSRDPYSFADIVPTGKQLAPIFTAGVDTIQIAFSEHVLLDGSELTLYFTDTVGPVSTIAPDNFSYDVGTHVATWTFDDPLPDSKFRLQLSTDVEDVGGNALDGEWSNMANGTFDNFNDDPTGRTFLTGNGVPGVAGGEFQFFFSLLAGDRNQDGVVTAADQGVGGDVDGDGDSDGADTTLVGTLLNHRLQLRKSGGDYLDDEVVDVNDYLLWKFTFGSTTDLRADGNSDGIVDLADYTLWRNQLGAQSAWSLVTTGAGLSFPVIQVGAAPQVTNVTVSGSQSVHDPYSFDSVAGSGEQLRTVPVGGADTIAITFSEDVNIMASDLSLVGLTTGNRPTLAEFDYDVSTMTASWRFTGWTFGDNYLLSLKDRVTDVEGNQLDGEWTNPATLFTVNSAVSEFPSGDGVKGGAFNFALTLLPGDATLDGVVDLSDLNLLLDNWGYTNLTFSDADFDGDGFVALGDLNHLNNNWGLNLQALWLRGDLDGDFDVDQDDLALVSSNQGMGSPAYADGDLDGDGDIDIDDLDFAFSQLGITFDLVS